MRGPFGICHTPGVPTGPPSGRRVGDAGREQVTAGQRRGGTLGRLGGGTETRGTEDWDSLLACLVSGPNTAQLWRTDSTAGDPEGGKLWAAKENKTLARRL